MSEAEIKVVGMALAVCPELRGHSHDRLSATMQRIHRL